MAYDPSDLLRALAEQEVDFVVIGGFAGTLHGSAYVTTDLDIAYSGRPENLERLAAMLASVHATLRGAPKGVPFLLDAKTLAAGANFTFDTDYGSFAILAHVDGAPPYEELFREAQVFRLGTFEVRAASLDHLIRMKEAAGRSQDKLHASEYRALSDEIRAKRGQ